MEKNNVLFRRFFLSAHTRRMKVRLIYTCSLLLVLLQLAGLFVPLQAQDKQFEGEILKAYELRINGKNDEAQAVLKSVLEADSTNAMAHFEMARALPMLSPKKLDHYTKASKYDPDNTMYCFHHADYIMLQSYVAMKKGKSNEEISSIVNSGCDHFKEVLKLHPECKETLLFLVDIYGNLPQEMGGNKAEAEKFLNRLRNVDPIYAAQGEWILSSDKMNLADYWQAYIDKNGEGEELMIKLGKAYLMNDNIEQAKECFDKIIAKDPHQAILYLDIARAHLYRAMRGTSSPEVEIPKVKKYIHNYLDAEKNKPLNVEAWCYGWLGTLEKKHGNDEEGEKYLALAKETFPNYSRATALPGKDNPPNVIAYNFHSYFSPF